MGKYEHYFKAGQENKMPLFYWIPCWMGWNGFSNWFQFLIEMS
jgi:hypothetical protein